MFFTFLGCMTAIIAIKGLAGVRGSNRLKSLLHASQPDPLATPRTTVMASPDTIDDSTA